MQKWNQFSQVLPPEGKPLLVSDGKYMTIARYNTADNHIIWYFDKPDTKEFQIVYWRELPPLPGTDQDLAEAEEIDGLIRRRQIETI